METKLTVQEVGQFLADHLNGCLRRCSDKWSLTFHADNRGVVTGATFTSPPEKPHLVGRKKR